MTIEGGKVAPRGRYAPSPTGELHLGNASTALLAWLSVRSRGGTFVMRVEDIDRPRVRAGMAERILDDLAWLGLDWDEGPDRGGPHAPYLQSERIDRHRDALDALRDDGRLYPCFCSRKDIAAAASAPQAPGDELRYPGTCRDLDAGPAAERIAEGRRHAWRVRVPEGFRGAFVDRVHGAYAGDPDPPGDFVVWRSDGTPAYHLAVVVDDATMEVDDVVRGDDLIPSTVRQILLQESLDHPRPSYAHVPLLLGSDGVRLSKRHRGTSLRELREAGMRPAQIIGRLARLLGLRDGIEEVSPRELAREFDPSRIRAGGCGIRVDAVDWPVA